MPFGSRLLVYSSMLLFSFEDCGPPGLPRMLQLDLAMRPDVHAALIAVHDSARWLEAVPCKSCAPVLLPVAALCFRVSCACSDALLPSLGMAHEEDHCQGNGLGRKTPCLQGHLTCLAACSVAAPSPPPRTSIPLCLLERQKCKCQGHDNRHQKDLSADRAAHCMCEAASLPSFLPHL